MKIVFKSGEFSAFKKQNLNESRQAVYESYNYYNERRKTIFISHKHDDLDDLEDLIGFLEKTYDVKCYIDSRDPLMPDITNSETATKIKCRIKQCDKFILLATNKAIASNWCNWELGFGDAQKFNNSNIALFPIASDEESFKGYEYMFIYPHIVKCNGDEKYDTGRNIEAGYYVRTIVKKGKIVITPLKTWLEQ